MKNKKLLLLTSASILAMVGVTGCGGKKSGPTEDKTKANISVMTFEGGVGKAWLEKAARRFEEIYKNSTEFQEGRVGVQVNIQASANCSGDNLLESGLTKDIYFTENVDYINLVNKGELADLTDVMTNPLTTYGENKTIISKIDTNFAAFLNRSNKYYAVPFYDAFYGFVYDADLFDAESLYLDRDGGFTNAKGDLSYGPDNQPNTYDDGLPATYDEFDTLLAQMRDNDITPFVTSDRGKGYMMRTLTNYWTNYEGLDKMMVNYTFNGTIDVVKSIVDGNVTKESKVITFDNGSELQKQPGKYYALDFGKNILLDGHGTSNYKNLTQHTEAQKLFVNGKYSSTPVAMIAEGSWWENEAVDAFAKLEKDKHPHGNYALMPIPHASKDMVGNKQTILSQNTSYGLVNKNTQNLSLAKEFMKFLHTDSELSKFTAETSMTRALNYELAEADKATVTTYGKSLLNVKATNNIIYPVSSVSKVINAASYFKTDTWAWMSEINGSGYNDPIICFEKHSNFTAEQYFNGLYKFFNDRWPSIK